MAKKDITPANAIRFSQYGSFYEENFIDQEIYRTITAGISPYLSQTRGITLEGLEGGGEYEGQYMAPQDAPMQSDYLTENIGPFLDEVGSGPGAIAASTVSNNALKTALQEGNVSLAEEIAMHIEGSHPTQSTPQGPTAELQALFMGQDIADQTEGVGKPTAMTNVVNLTGGGKTAQPADVIRNSPGADGIIHALTSIAGEAVPKWKNDLAKVKFVDITESYDKKWIMTQIKGGAPSVKQYRDKEGKQDAAALAAIIATWKSNFDTTMGKVNEGLSSMVKGLGKLPKSGTGMTAEAEKIIRIMTSGYASEGATQGKGDNQTPQLVTLHLMNIWNLSFREYIASSYDEMPLFFEQQPIGDTGYWAAILGKPNIKGGAMSFDWDVTFIDIGHDGGATDGVIIAEWAAARGMSGGLTAQAYYDLARAEGVNWYIQSAGRANMIDDWVMGLVDSISQPELNIELMPDSVKGGFVGPVTQIAGKDIAKTLYEQIKEQAKEPGYTGPYADLYTKMLEVANNATKAWKMSAGIKGGELFGEALNDYAQGGIWPDDDMTWNGNVGKDLGVSPFLVGTKEYVKIFSDTAKDYNVTLAPKKTAQVRAKTPDFARGKASANLKQKVMKLGRYGTKASKFSTSTDERYKKHVAKRKLARKKK